MGRKCQEDGEQSLLSVDILSKEQRCGGSAAHGVAPAGEGPHLRMTTFQCKTGMSGLGCST